MAFPGYGNPLYRGISTSFTSCLLLSPRIVCDRRKEELKEHGDSHGHGVILEL